jgi:hypothetical protein
MAYKRYYQLVTMSYEGTTIEATCFTQALEYGFRHGLTSVRIFYSDSSSRIHDRVELGLKPFTVNYLNRTWEARKYDSLLFALFDMLFKRKGWDTSKEHHKQVLNVIEYGSRIYKDLTEA